MEKHKKLKQASAAANDQPAAAEGDPVVGPEPQPTNGKKAAAPGAGVVKVIDRRHWAAGNEAESAAEPRHGKPTFVEELEKQLAGKDQTLRDYIAAHKQAERGMEDYKSRLRRDREAELNLAKAQLAGRFLEVLDNLERTIEHAQRGGDLPSLVSGTALVREQFLKVLAAFGLERIKAAGEPFDPRYHEAVAAMPAADPAQSGKVLEEMRGGYRLGEQVVRPSQVVVATPPTGPEATPAGGPTGENS